MGGCKAVAAIAHLTLLLMELTVAGAKTGGVLLLYTARRNGRLSAKYLAIPRGPTIPDSLLFVTGKITRMNLIG
jgi:hypothetical protein